VARAYVVDCRAIHRPEQFVITPADDYLTHQTPHTFDTVFTSDKNFYDRYFMNGYARDGSVYFALAMGLYPNLDIIDSAFSVVVDGTQYVVRASRRLNRDRMATRVGPISVQVAEPLKRIRVRIARNKWGITGDLTFEARGVPFEEPHFFRRAGALVVMDYTRMTQHGSWSGILNVDGKKFDVSSDNWWGSRDHSWGIRGVGGGDQRGAPAPAARQFFWNWAPVNFEDSCTLYTVSENADGSRWHESGAILTPYPDGGAVETEVAHDLTFQKGTRYISGAKVTLTPPKGRLMTLEFKPMYHFLMKGLGYTDPKWGHGMWVGEEEVDGLQYDLATEEPLANLHVQTISQVTAGRRKGIGVFEHIVIGPHAKYGFKDVLDPAK
jgi:hypothetical protein